MSVILSTAYFPNILYISKCISEKFVSIEASENYTKKSFRNRTEILSANGKLSLSIPVVKTNAKFNIKDIKIDYSEDWQKNHLKAIEAAYKSSPFFEFYIDDFIKFFENKYDNLLEYNTLILKEVFNALQINTEVKFTSHFETRNSNNNDYRFGIHPRIQYDSLKDKFLNNKYKQVFSEKHLFEPNLSILDLIFNLGPESVLYLEKALI